MKAVIKVTVEKIIDGCCSGDADARKVLYERYAPQMYGVVRRYIKDIPTAEDLLHDGFITVFTKINDYRADGVFDAWCRRVFVNTALNYLRKTAQFEQEEFADFKIESQNGSDSIIEKLSVEDIKKSIDLLPEGYKTILNLHAIEGYSHTEIAELLNISESTSRSQYSRARIKLTDIMKRI